MTIQMQCLYINISVKSQNSCKMLQSLETRQLNQLHWRFRSRVKLKLPLKTTSSFLFPLLLSLSYLLFFCKQVHFIDQYIDLTKILNIFLRKKDSGKKFNDFIVFMYLKYHFHNIFQSILKSVPNFGEQLGKRKLLELTFRECLKII